MFNPIVVKENEKWFAYFNYRTVELGFGEGKTKEQALHNLCASLSARLVAISDSLVSPSYKHPHNY
jgi:hypothetical protein